MPGRWNSFELSFALTGCVVGHRPPSGATHVTAGAVGFWSGAARFAAAFLAAGFRGAAFFVGGTFFATGASAVCGAGSTVSTSG